MTQTRLSARAEGVEPCEVRDRFAATASPRTAKGGTPESASRGHPAQRVALVSRAATLVGWTVCEGTEEAPIMPDGFAWTDGGRANRC